MVNKFTINAKSLREKLLVASSILEKDDAYISIKEKEQQSFIDVVAAGNDFLFSFVIPVQGKIDSSDDKFFSIDVNKLYKYISKCNKEEIEIKKLKSRLSIEDGTSSFSLNFLSEDNELGTFNIFETYDKSQSSQVYVPFEILYSVLKTMINVLSYSPRGISDVLTLRFNNAFFEAEAGDTYRFYNMRFNYTNSDIKEMRIDRNGASKLFKVLHFMRKTEPIVSVVIYEKHYAIECCGYILFLLKSNISISNFADIEKRYIFDQNISVRKTEIESALSKIDIVSREKEYFKYSFLFSIDTEKSCVNVKASSSNAYVSEEIKIENMENISVSAVSLSSKLLLETINEVKDDIVVISFSGEFAPVMISRNDGSFKAIVTAFSENTEE